MKREYNHNISERANERIQRREHTVRIQKRMIVITAILMISAVILLGSSIRAFAGSRDYSQPVYKYYTSIQVQSGDTLWDIADTYTREFDIDKEEYIDEVCRMNHLQNGEIHSGDYITVAYYSGQKQ